MQHSTGRLRPALTGLCLAVAALLAPPPALANGAGTGPTIGATFVPAPGTTQQTNTGGSQLVAPSSQTLRVGLVFNGRTHTSVQITAPGGLQVIAGGAVHWKTLPNQVVKLNLSGGKIQVAGLAEQFASPVRLVPVKAAGSYVSYAGRQYRGELEVVISPKHQRLSVVNVIDLEEYLLGVLPGEMEPSWPFEAVKAQAVAARTYALRNKGRFANEGFDLDDSPATSQVYKGVNVERERATAAVTQTRGRVLKFEGRLASTFYFSSSGGHTENVETIWHGSPITYLRGVPDFDNLPGNRWYSWQYTYTLAEFSEMFRAAGKDVGRVAQVKPSGTVGASGRPSHWLVIGSGGRQVTLKADREFRREVLGLPSAPRTVTIKQSGWVDGARSLNPADQVYVVGAGGKVSTRTAGTSFVVGTGGVQRSAAAGAVVKAPAGWEPQAEATVEIVGGGWGHGVGMSQWGAHGMALLGKNYVEILTHFYRGTKVEAAS